MHEDNTKKLFLLDAYALIFRAYYAFIRNPRVTSKGLNTSAIFGFLLTLDEVLQKQKPSHIAVVFDTPAPTFRHEMYKEYKATRDETPEDIKKAVPYIKRLLEAYKIPIIDCPGFEADDIKREFSVERPEQVIDILALMGDTSDNIPGAPGVGPKTAMKLISEFGSVEELFKNTGKLKGKLKEIIENNREQIEISKKLATIVLDVPVVFKEEELITEAPDFNKLKSLFDELEFRTVAARILAEADRPEKTPAQKEVFDTPKEH